MKILDKNEKEIIIDIIGERIIKEVFDSVLYISRNYISGETKNIIKKEQYKSLSKLDLDSQNKINELLTEVVKSTIFSFFDLFDLYNEDMKFNIKYNNDYYDIRNIFEKVGAEITFEDEDGWIKKFSKI